MVEKILNKPFVQKSVPSGKEICEKQLFSLIDKMENTEVNEGQIGEFMPAIYKKLAWLDREELIKHFVSVEFNRFLTYYENAPDINVDESRSFEKYSDEEGRSARSRRGRGERSDRAERGGRTDRGDRSEKRRGGNYEFSRFFFNLGKKNGVGKRTIIDLINQNLPNKNVEIGSIEVLKSFSFFEVDKKYENEVLKAFKNANYKGQRVGIDIAKGK
jgi:ATP-dependent RNA helicase DeaD